MIPSIAQLLSPIKAYYGIYNYLFGENANHPPPDVQQDREKKSLRAAKQIGIKAKTLF